MYRPIKRYYGVQVSFGTLCCPLMWQFAYKYGLSVMSKQDNFLLYTKFCDITYQNSFSLIYKITSACHGLHDCAMCKPLLLILINLIIYRNKLNCEFFVQITGELSSCDVTYFSILLYMEKCRILHLILGNSLSKFADAACLTFYSWFLLALSKQLFGKSFHLSTFFM